MDRSNKHVPANVTLLTFPVVTFSTDPSLHICNSDIFTQIRLFVFCLLWITRLLVGAMQLVKHI